MARQSLIQLARRVSAFLLFAGSFQQGAAAQQAASETEIVSAARRLAAAWDAALSRPLFLVRESKNYSRPFWSAKKLRSVKPAAVDVVRTQSVMHPLAVTIAIEAALSWNTCGPHATVERMRATPISCGYPSPESALASTSAADFDEAFAIPLDLRLTYRVEGRELVFVSGSQDAENHLVRLTPQEVQRTGATLRPLFRFSINR